MFGRQRIRVRLALAIVLTALIPVTAAIVLSRSMVQQSSERFFVPEIRERLEQSLGAYRDLTSMTKANMRSQAQALALDPDLRLAVVENRLPEVERRLNELILAYPTLARLSALDEDGEVLSSVNRGRPIDPETEHQLVVKQPLTGGFAAKSMGGGEATPAHLDELDEAAEENEDEGAQLLVHFATSKARFDEFERLGDFIDAYAVLEERRDTVEQTYVLAFAALLGITIVLAVGAGTLLARGVAVRLSELAIATREVAAGDLSIRVSENGKDEISELGRAFNRMLGEMDSSRSRIEYLSRLASWQDMARRLAHEIKNPLTPIQLAVQEMHQRLAPTAADQRQVLDTTLEIVESEVQTLRRLVTEFSEFARLPQSHIEPSDLFEFLRELAHQSGGRAAYFNFEGAQPKEVEMEIPKGAAPAEIDAQMLRRALINLIKNALEACAEVSPGRVRLRAAATESGYRITVDDNGPGVSKDLQSRVFEPYVTTKDDGTGLGLAIVKKIVIDHGGSIEMKESDWGGARVQLELPRFRASLAAAQPTLVPG